MVNYAGLLFCITVLWVHAQTPPKQPDCTTPGKQPGRCIPFQDCRELITLFKSRPYRETEVYFKEATCGVTGGLEQTLCCSVNGNDFLIYSTPSAPGGNDPLSSSAPETTTMSVTPSILPPTDQCGREMGFRMVGAKVADLDEFPWMALLEYSKSSETAFHCSGTLISKKYVLTAAHCITMYKDNGWDLKSVRLGEHTLQNKSDCTSFCADAPVDVPVEESIVHELFDPRFVDSPHNVALLRLTQEMISTDYIHPICLPPTDDPDYPSRTMFISGWGKTEKLARSGEKMKLQIKATAQDICVATYLTARVEIKEGQMCAGGVKGEDSCLGDGGGPLMLFNETISSYFVVGITAFGNAICGTAGWPSVYTRVVNYIPWITSKLKP